MKFKVGDKVKCISDTDSKAQGLEGIVVVIDERCPNFSLGVNFLNWYEGHDLEGLLPEGSSGWWVREQDLVLTEEASNPTLEDEIKALQDKWNIEIEKWSKKLPESIPLGQIMKLRSQKGWEYTVQLVQVNGNVFRFISLDSGNRIDEDLNLAGQYCHFKVSSIEAQGYKILELLDNPFKE